MKRIIAIIISLIIGCSSLGAIDTVQATTSDANPVTFSISSAFGQNGEKAKVFIDIEENSMMSAAVFKLKYDATMLKAQHIEIGTVLQEGYTSKNITTRGEVMVSYANTSPVYSEGRLFEVEFDIIGAVPAGKQFIEIPVELEIQDLVGFDYSNITPVISNGVVSVVDISYGDSNIDGLVAPSDTLMILNHAVNLIELTETQKMNSDVNGDGEVNAVDAMFILRYTAGVISTYPIFELEAPTGLSVKAKDETYIELSWDHAEFACGYNLYMNDEKVNENLITDTSFVVDSLEQDTKYSFHVTAENVLKESENSEEIEISTNKADRYVTFLDYDGTVIENQIVLSGTNAVKPKNPSREGYTFVGWDKSLNNILLDTTITAQYEINNYTVNFETNGGTAVSTQKKTYGSLLEKPATPTRTDYTFMGWYTDSAFVNEWDFSTDTLSKNITLYAKWATWSEWTTDTTLKNNVNYEVQSKVQYSYRDKSTKTSTSSSLSGWTQNGSYITYGAWTNVGWTKTKPATSTTLQITNTRTVTDSAAYTRYNYYYYRYWNSSAGAYYYTYHGNYGGTYKEHTTTSPIPYNQTASGYALYGPTSIYYKNELWFLRSTQNVPAVTHTEWYYQTRTATTNYNYYKWSSWSSWLDSSVSATSNREIKTRTVYRYRPIQQ